MSGAPIQQIKLDPGGIIPNNAPENQVLFAQIRATSALSTTDLLKIARFLGRYATNTGLATHLASAAMQRLTGSPLLQEAPLGNTVIDGAPLKEVAHLAGDFFSLGPEGPDPRAGIRWLPLDTPIPGLGLLVETYVSATSPDQPFFQAVGICPAPASLPD